MIPSFRPRFEILVGTASAEERRLITIAKARALTGLTVANVTDATLTALIDAALAQCARYCKLAKAGSAPPTFARETVRATWTMDAHWPARSWYWHQPDGWPNQLILPWRVPITAITITEGETELVENTDYRLMGGAMVERAANTYWPTTGTLVVDYTAGWLPVNDDESYDYDDGDPMPDDLVAAICDQIRLSVSQRSTDPLLRSEDVPGVWSGTYNVPGGDTIDADGMLFSLQCALAPYRDTAASIA